MSSPETWWVRIVDSHDPPSVARSPLLIDPAHRDLSQHSMPPFAAKG